MDTCDTIATGGYTCGNGLDQAITSIAVDGYLCDIETGSGGPSGEVDFAAAKSFNKREKQIREEDEILLMVAAAFMECMS